MSVGRTGIEGAAQPRDASVGVHTGDGHRKPTTGEQPMVPKATFSSYYGRPVLKSPVWKSRDIAGYFFAGGLAGASSVLAAGAQLTGRRALAKRAKLVALGGVAVSAAALVHDLGVPSRFYNMLRVAKPTSPMSVGSWLLTGYGPAAGVAALTGASGRMPRTGALATGVAAALGPAVTSYTGVLIGDTALPAWHDASREMPFVFAASAATAAGGAGLIVAPTMEAGPARRLAVAGAAAELVASSIMRKRIGMVAEAYETTNARRFLEAGKYLTAGGAAIAFFGRRHRLASAAAGAAMMAASACTRFGIFHAGVASAEDPRFTVEPQRERLSP